MPMPALPGLESLPVSDHPDLLAPSVAAALADWPHAADVAVVEIDPAVADTAAMNEAYGLSETTGANCVVVAGKRDGEERVAACLVRADTRADVNAGWRVLVDPRVLEIDVAVIGSGVRRSKLLVPGALLGELPRAEVVDGLAVEVTAP